MPYYIIQKHILHIWRSFPYLSESLITTTLTGKPCVSLLDRHIAHSKSICSPSVSHTLHLPMHKSVAVGIYKNTVSLVQEAR